MSHAAKIAVSKVQYIPLDKLVLSDTNVRKTFRKEGFDELVASIEAHGLLQNLSVAPERDLEGNETGRFEVFAGGRRFTALTRLARQKKIARNVPIPCIVRTDGIAEELSLVENVVREMLHPADQFEAFKDLSDNKGLGVEEIASRFGVSGRTVKERLRLASVSPNLLKLYREGDLTLDQVTAFTVSDNHARQEEVWQNSARDHSPEAIRRALTTTHVAANDRRALFVGRDAYEAAGGVIFRDLFAEDDGGYFVNVPLLEKLAAEKLEGLASTVGAEGWKWAAASVEYPHSHGMRRVYPQEIELEAPDADRLEAVEAELDALDGEIEGGESDQAATERYNTLVAEYEVLSAKSRVFTPEQIAIAGAFVTIGRNGQPEIIRGLVCPEDEVADDSDEASEHEEKREALIQTGLSAALIQDLTAQRTMAIRAALGADRMLALRALAYDLANQTFRCGETTCLSLTAISVGLESSAKGISGGIAAQAIEKRHAAWAMELPGDSAALWAHLEGLELDRLLDLVAHCIALTVDVVQRPHDRVEGKVFADTLAASLKLDMREYWTPTAASYFGRVSKALILEAISEGVSPEAAKRVKDAKKVEMAGEAERLLAEGRWLPVCLRQSISAHDEVGMKAAQ